MENREIRVAVLGAGGRGLTYAHYLKQNAPNWKVVAVADPLPGRLVLAREMFADIPDDHLCKDWRDVVAKGRIADAVIIATLEDIHEPIAVACAEQGYDILLEKPMAPTEEACRRIVAAAESSGGVFAVCHVLRYTRFFATVKGIIDDGLIGEVVHVQHVEDVPYWHFSHGFVRGHNHNSSKTSFILLSKSCHDVDILRFLIGKRCLRVHSFGSLTHFRRDNKPPEAGDAMRCEGCSAEPTCPWSAQKIYVRDRLVKGLLRHIYPRGPRTAGHSGVSLTADVTHRQEYAEAVEALRTGPLGMCVYECDNNVCDHQCLNLEYEGGVTAQFQLNAFNEGGRKTVVHGTRGIVRAEIDTGIVRWLDFLTDTWHEIRTGESSGDIADGHSGGDDGLMREWVTAVESRDASRILSGPRETLETHLVAFAAERSRLNGSEEKVVC